MIDGYDMVGVDGFGTLKGEVRYDQDVQKMANFFRFVHNDEELEVEFQTGIYLHTRKDINLFFLVSIDYDNKMFCWKWREEQTQLNFNNWIDIRIVTNLNQAIKRLESLVVITSTLKLQIEKNPMIELILKRKCMMSYFNVNLLNLIPMGGKN